LQTANSILDSWTSLCCQKADIAVKVVLDRICFRLELSEESRWKNTIGGMEVFQCGPLRVEIDNNMKNMPMVAAWHYVISIAPFLLHPVMTGAGEDLS
jgi:hypothetical protein